MRCINLNTTKIRRAATAANLLDIFPLFNRFFRKKISKNNELAVYVNADANNNSNKARKIMQANKSDNDTNAAAAAAMAIVGRTVACDE